MISAPASGTGKTTVTLGLIAALRARGMEVQPFKSGPDYIDPAFHAAAAGRASVNLDGWAMPQAMVQSLARAGEDAGIVVAEGSMGLYDGVAQPGAWGTGASADIAALMGWPVVLVLDVSGQAQTAAAVASGLAGFRSDLRVAGVVLNRVASPRHEALVRAGMDAAGLRVFGALPREPAVALPERHLGLVQAEEQGDLAGFLARAGAFVARHLDLDALVAAAEGGFAPPTAAEPPPPAGYFQTENGRIAPPGQRIALARDAAFSFVYPHLLAGWRAAGAEVLPFSPLADEAPDASADVCWLPGGYPELHAGRLAASERFRAGLQAFAGTRPVHGECGGYMTLGAGLVDKDGVRHRMAGLLGLETSFARRRMHLGYRLAELMAPIPGAEPGARLRGHEFHYATILNQPDDPLARVSDATGADIPETGARRGHVTGTFFHMIARAA